MSFFGREKVIIVDNWNYRGPHVASQTYAAGDAVGSGDALYVAIQDVPANTAITDTNYWVSGLQGPVGPVGPPPLIQFSDDGTTFYDPPATSLTIGYRYSQDTGASWSGFIQTKGNVGPRGFRGEGLEPSNDRLNALIDAYLQSGNYITQNTALELVNNVLRAVTDASIFAEALFSIDRNVWHAQLAAYRYVWFRKIEEDRNTDSPEVVLDLGIVALGEIIGLTFTHGLKKDGNTVEIDESAFDDTVSTAFYTSAGNDLPTESSLFALSNADGSTFFDIQDSNLDWQAIGAPGRIYITNTQGDHIGPFGTDGTKTTADYEADDKLIIQAANPLTAPTLTLTLNGGPTDFGSGDGAGKYYSYSAIAVDVDFALDPSDSYRVALDAHPVIQILAGNVKGNKWVELTAGNLEEWTGAPAHILSVNATGVKEQPYDDLQKTIVNVDTTVRFPSVERQADNAATPNANYFSIHTPVDGAYPVRWTAKNARQRTFLIKFLKAQQVLQFDINASGRMRLLADATVSGNTFSFDTIITGTVPPVGQIYDMYSLGRALGEIYVQRSQLKPKEKDFWGDFGDDFLDASIEDKRWSIGFTSDTSGTPTLENQYDTLGDVPEGAAMLVISPTQFDTPDLNNPNVTPGNVTLTAEALTDPMFFHYNLDTSGKNYMKFTPTGTVSTIGTENGQLFYVIGTVEKHGTIARVSDGGTLDNTTAGRDREPSSFFDELLIPWKAIANFNIANYITSLRQLLASTSATLSQTTKVLLSDFKTATLAHLAEHIYPQTTKPREIASTFKTDLVNVNNKNGNIAFQNAFSRGCVPNEMGVARYCRIGWRRQYPDCGCQKIFHRSPLL